MLIRFACRIKGFVQTEYRVKFHKLYCVISYYKITSSVVEIKKVILSSIVCISIIRNIVKCSLSV